MDHEIFIPHNANELYEKMIREQFTGQLSLEDDHLIWKLPNGITIKVTFSTLFPEAYLGTCCLDGKKEIPLAHWHPMIEDVYRDLSEINNGQIFWVKRKKKGFLTNNFPVIMYKKEWENLNEKRKGKYIIL